MEPVRAVGAMAELRAEDRSAFGLLDPSQLALGDDATGAVALLQRQRYRGAAKPMGDRAGGNDAEAQVETGEAKAGAGRAEDGWLLAQKRQALKQSLTDAGRDPAICRRAPDPISAHHLLHRDRPV